MLLNITHLFASPLVLKFEVVGGPNSLVTASSDVKCMRSATEVSNDWDYIPCTIISGYADYTGTSFSVFSTALVKSKEHSYANRYGSMVNEVTSVVSLTRCALTNDIIGRTNKWIPKLASPWEKQRNDRSIREHNS